MVNIAEITLSTGTSSVVHLLYLYILLGIVTGTGTEFYFVGAGL
jgi:hypothetical protein